MRRLFAIPIILGIFFCSCALAATPPGSKPKSPSPEQTLRKGVELYKAGEGEEALSTLRGFLLRYPDSPLLSEACLYLARIFHDRGEFQDALLYLRRIPAERRGGAARLIEGAALVGTGEAERGVAILQPIPSDSLTPSDRKLRLLALADGSARTGKPLTALSYLHRALPEADRQEAGKILGQARFLLRERLGDGELAEAAAMFSGTAIGEEARLQQGRRANRGEVKRTAAALPEPAKQTEAGPTVGVILPLSGRYAEFGALVRRGMELALTGHPESGVRFRFVDSEGDSQASARTVGELASDPNVLALAGPLTRAAAAAAASRAQQEKVTLLTLSQKEGLPRIGDHIFRLSLTASAQVKALVDWVMGKKGMTSFAILAPETRLGQEMSDLFAAEVGKRGGEIVHRTVYPDKATDFKTQVRQLAGREDDKGRKEKGGEKKEPKVFEALFIPDSADRISLIAPQLSYYGLPKVQLLGTNGWNSPGRLRPAARHIEGAVFVDGFFSGSPEPAVADFVARYTEEFRREPSLLEAQAFDVAGIYLSLLADPAVRTREDVRQALSRLARYPGVTGETTFDADGEAQRSLFLLQMKGGVIVPVD